MGYYLDRYSDLVNHPLYFNKPLLIFLQEDALDFKNDKYPQINQPETNTQKISEFLKINLKKENQNKNRYLQFFSFEKSDYDHLKDWSKIIGNILPKNKK